MSRARRDDSLRVAAHGLSRGLWERLLAAKETFGGSGDRPQFSGIPSAQERYPH